MQKMLGDLADPWDNLRITKQGTEDSGWGMTDIIADIH